MKKQLILILVIVAFNANLYSQDGPFRFDGAEDVLIGNSRHWDAKQDVNSNLIWNTWSNRYFTMNGATFRQDGSVGIGTTTPSAKLDVHGASKIRGGGGLLQLFGNKSGTATHAYISFNNLVGSQTAVLGFTDPAANHMYVWNKKGNIGFINGPSGSHSVNLQIMSNGRVGIGTTSPGAKLAVNGDIHAEEVRVDLTVPGPDYVFEEDYDLPTLESIESYIRQNKHLPEVPSATEMEENGIDVGVMNMLLLKKVEELTLHLIELDHRNRQQDIKIQKLESELRKER
ncbi:MAG: tail fiber protein [Cytophagales bacterium]|nr:tail fiber protein [Cytophagales bacterium]